METIFGSAQAYVVLGRVQSLDQLNMSSFNQNMIKTNKKALEEATKLHNHALINQEHQSWCALEQSTLKISSLNARSLRKHFSSLAVDFVLLHSNIICINETFLSAADNMKQFSLPHYKLITCSGGRGSGVAVYIKDNLNIVGGFDANKTSHQILKVQFPNFDLVAVYRSPSQLNEDDFLSDLQLCIDQDQKTIICGDFNIAYGKSRSNITPLWRRQVGFIQIINQPTHIQGNTRHHIYLKSLDPLTHFIHPLYFSDHDATCVLLKSE